MPAQVSVVLHNPRNIKDLFGGTVYFKNKNIKFVDVRETPALVYLVWSYILDMRTQVSHIAL